MQVSCPQSVAEEYRQSNGFYPLIIGREYWHGGQSAVLVSATDSSHQVTMRSRFGDTFTARREEIEWKPDADVEEMKSKPLKNGRRLANESVVIEAGKFIEENIDTLVASANHSIRSAKLAVRSIKSQRDVETFVVGAKTALVLFIQEKIDNEG